MSNWRVNEISYSGYYYFWIFDGSINLLNKQFLNDIE